MSLMNFLVDRQWVHPRFELINLIKNEDVVVYSKIRDNLCHNI